MPKDLPRTRERRAWIEARERLDLDWWICERCGDGDEEGLAAYMVRRATRRQVGCVFVLCATCAEKTCKGADVLVVSD